MNDFTIIITMAGIGSRFRKAGFSVPKYMIEARGKTLFEWSMDSLLDFNQYATKYIFIVQKKDDAKEFIIEKCKSYDVPEIEIIELEYPTDGQATTCLKAIPHCQPESAILIYNIDTYVEPPEMKYANISGDGHIPCFKAPGDHWSFIKLDDSGKAIEIAEKRRISDYCSIGAYYFSSAALYKKLYFNYYSDDTNLVRNEKYIAPLYNEIIKSGGKVTISILESAKVHVLGTPEELNQFLYSES